MSAPESGFVGATPRRARSPAPVGVGFGPTRLRPLWRPKRAQSKEDLNVAPGFSPAAFCFRVCTCKPLARNKVSGLVPANPELKLVRGARRFMPCEKSASPITLSSRQKRFPADEGPPVKRFKRRASAIFQWEPRKKPVWRGPFQIGSNQTLSLFLHTIISRTKLIVSASQNGRAALQRN